MTEYWESHYARGGTSGRGSEGVFVIHKAGLVNDHLMAFGIETVLDIGSGDGVVAGKIEGPDYLGVDQSPTAVRLAQAKNPGRTFQLLNGSVAPRQAHLSLDVIHHLVDDTAYQNHMRLLFSAERLVLIWVADWKPTPTDAQNIHRKWFEDVPDEWYLYDRIPIHGEPVSFWIYDRSGQGVGDSDE